VFIHSASFDSQTIQPIDSVYTVRVLYPKALAPEIGAYTRIIDNAFTRAGRLFGERRGAHPTLEHSVLITAGLAGNTLDEGTRVYPDPSARVSMFVRTPNYARAEELYIHAVMHLYNRQREGLLAYQDLQSPFAAEDWQEMEATWAESAFNTSSSGREGRLKYLYNVHTAVVTKNFALISEPPFTDKDGFEKIVPSIAVAKGGAYLDYQYGHYVLAPLVMLAIEGLLQERKTGATVESMLLAVHAEGTRFFDNPAQVLSEKDLARIRSWSTGDGLIPMALLESAVAYYDSQ
jgi:hypothetical protein